MVLPVDFAGVGFDGWATGFGFVAPAFVIFFGGAFFATGFFGATFFGSGLFAAAFFLAATFSFAAGFAAFFFALVFAFAMVRAPIPRAAGATTWGPPYS